MATTTAVSLTGDDLTLADVWAVAVEGASAELSEEGRRKLAAARALVERAASESSGEHTYGINTGFGRFVERTIPPELS
ncbi:MAG: aromatic amino acid lyase, partial [Gaiellaceae bacterium]